MTKPRKVLGNSADHQPHFSVSAFKRAGLPATVAFKESEEYAERVAHLARVLKIDDCAPRFFMRCGVEVVEALVRSGIIK